MKKEKSIFVKVGYLLGILFCLVASVSLVYASYLIINWTFSEHTDISYYEYETSGQYSDYPSTKYNCDEKLWLKNESNEVINRFEIKRIDYEDSKRNFFASSGIENQLDAYDKLGDEYNLLISIFNELVNTYNEDSIFFDTCDNTFSTTIETKRGYLDNEEKSLDKEFGILKPKAEAEGYVFE